MTYKRDRRGRFASKAASFRGIFSFMEPGTQFSGARQGVRYRGNGGRGAYMPTEHEGPHGQQALELESSGWHDMALRPVLPESVEYGHTATERQHDPTKWNGQMALPGMPKPTSPDIHRLRQANPSLNDYQFTVSARKNRPTDGRQGVPSTPHRVQVHDSSGNRVGDLKLGYEQDDWDTHPGHREVAEIAVAPKHAGRGLGEAMYDLARMRGTKILHSNERSEGGESFTNRVGGPKLKRTKGHGADDYLGIHPNPNKV